MTYFKSNVNLDSAAIIEKIEATGYLWREPNPGQPNQLHNMYNSSYGISPHLWPELRPLIEQINLLSNDLPISKSWFHIMLKGSVISEHIHPNAIKYVCSYYPQITSDHPPIELKIDDVYVPIELQTNDFILFDKDIWHRVQEQNVDHRRITIVFNI